ncbi:outer membrane beta-barrel protein [Photobacterium sp. DNB22_13_2]
MKKLLATAALTLLTTAPMVASANQHHTHHHYHHGGPNAYQGPRVGLGISYLSDRYIDTDTGFKLEGGYDFNRIVGFNLSYEESGYDYYRGSVDYSTVKFGTDLGYAFPLSQSVSLKPYVSLGFHRTTEDDRWCSSKHCYSTNYSDTNTYYGIGMRLTADMFYINVSNEVLKMDVGNYRYEPDQIAVTVGLKL